MIDSHVQKQILAHMFHLTTALFKQNKKNKIILHCSINEGSKQRNSWTNKYHGEIKEKKMICIKIHT